MHNICKEITIPSLQPWSKFPLKSKKKIFIYSHHIHVYSKYKFSPFGIGKNFLPNQNVK